MFTGIVQAVGRITRIEERGGDRLIEIDTDSLPLDTAKIGDSIAVSGVCLTAVAFRERGFRADVSRETLACSTLARLRVGAPVNLETALTLASPLGGHLMSGHVDGMGRVRGRRQDARSQRWSFDSPPELLRFIAAKGSISVDGVSLTVNAVDAHGFEVNLVPHTVQNTAFASSRVGDAVNLEVDMLARYVDRLRQFDSAPSA